MVPRNYFPLEKFHCKLTRAAIQLCKPQSKVGLAFFPLSTINNFGQILRLSQDAPCQINSIFYLIIITYSMERNEKKEDYKAPQDMFTTLDKSSKKSEEVQEYSIVLIGLSKVGKSSLHNAVNCPNNLVGKRLGVKTFYELRAREDPNTANISDQITSVTVVPNVSRVPDSSMTFVDLPGLDDRGDPIDIIKVNFINAQFFQAARKVKFILVIAVGALIDTANNKGFKDSLQKFLAFFDLEKFSSEEKSQLFASVSICVTSVDFRGNGKEETKKQYLQELEYAIGKLGKWYKQNPAQMPNFPAAKELIDSIIKQERIWLFQLAVHDKSPADNTIIQSLDRHNWKFFDLQKKMDKITFHFDKQYQGLKQDQKQFVDKNIKKRFQFLTISTAIGQMLAKLFKDFRKKVINFDEQLETISKEMQKLPKYDKPDQKRFKHEVCTVDQRLHQVQRLDTAAKRVEAFDTWKDTNKKSPVSEYYTRHISGVFEDQLAAISMLLGFSPDAIEMLNNLYVNVNKMLAQAAVFASLSKTYESEFKNKLVTSLVLGGEIGSMERVKEKFVQSYQNGPHQEDDFLINEVISIIEVFSKLKGQLIQISPTVFSEILCRFQHTLAHKYKQRGEIALFLKHSYEALFEAAKAHMCFALVPLQTFKKQLKELVELQKQILAQTLQVFDQRKNQDQIDMNYRILVGFENLTRINQQAYLRSILKNLFENLADITKIVDRSSNQNHRLNTASSILSNQAIDHTINQYRSVMRSHINEEKLKIKAPRTYSFCSQVHFYDKIKDFIKGKKVIFVVGEPLSGKTAFIEALKRKKLCLDKEGRIDLERQSIFSTINHTNTPNRYPHLSILNESEFIVEIPSHCELPPQEEYIKKCLFLDLMKSTNQFRVVMIFKETTLISLKENKENHFGRTLIQMASMLDPQKSSGKGKKGKEPISVITLVVSYSSKDKPACRKILEGAISSLGSVDAKAAKYLTQTIEKNQYICEPIQKSNIIAQDFESQQGAYLDSSQLSITYGDLYTKFTHKKESFLHDVGQKMNLIKATINPLYNLASAAVNQFVEGQRPTEKNWFFKEIVVSLENQISNRYELDIWSLPEFETRVSSMDNRPQLFYRLVELRQLASNFVTGNELSGAYRSIGNYMENFFNTMVYLCCSNRQQYHSFMRAKTVLTDLLKELEFYSLIFNDCSCPQLEDLKESMWPTELADATTNFPDFKREELMSKMLRKPTSWRQDDFKSSIKLLNHYISKDPAFSSVTTAARIQLLIFTLRLKKKKNFEIDWNMELTEQRLIEAILKNSFISTNLPQNHQKSLEKKNKSLEQIEKNIIELQRLKRKLLA